MANYAIDIEGYDSKYTGAEVEAKLDRIHDVPTLTAAPDETVLQFNDGQRSHSFHIGDLCRVADEQSESGYAFYRLHDITADNKAVWMEEGTGGNASHEVVTLRLASNQSAADTRLAGLKVHFTYGNWDEQLEWKMVDLIVTVPANMDYTIEAQSLDGFATPQPVTLTAAGGAKRTVTLEYKAEEVVVLASIPEGKEAAGKTVTVTGADEVVYLSKPYGTAGEGLRCYIPFGMEYRVTMERVSGCRLPDAIVHTGALVTREVTMVVTVVEQSYLVIDLSRSVTNRITLEQPAKANALLARFRRALEHPDDSGTPTVCYLSDSNSAQFADGAGATLDGSCGQCVTYLPEVYYLFEQMDDTHIRYCITDTQPDEGYVHLPASLIGTYKGGMAGEQYGSYAGVVPLTDRTKADLQAMAESLGEGWGLVRYFQRCLLAMMLYARYRDHDMQRIIGTSLASYNANHTTGSTVALGTTDSHPADAEAGTAANYTAYNNALGVEGIFGCIYELLHDATLTGKVWTVGNPDGTTRQVETIDVGTGWISKMRLEEGPFFDLLPTACNGSSSTYYGDFSETAKSDYLPLCMAVSCFTATDTEATFPDDGIAYVNALQMENNPSPFYGSRIAYVGTIRIEESSAAYLQMIGNV